MSRFSKIALALLLFLFADIFVSEACTSVIISGKLTEDGRPLMWKNRDAPYGQNMTVYIKGAKYDFLGVINPGVKNPRSVWGGVNSEGLCVMNTMSYNIDIKPVDDDKAITGNGGIQFRLLSNCRDMGEVESYLDSIYGILTPEDLQVPTGLTTNLGVIDAKGNGAYFECHSYGYKKYDVNDPKVAPDGYLVRSNYSISTRPAAEGVGQIRYMEAERQVRHAIADKRVNVDFILENLARSFSNPMLGVDLKSGKYNKPYTNGWYSDQDFITNYLSVSSLIFQGVKAGENPELTTMWTIIGYPAAAVCVPVWVKGGEEGIPAMLAADADRKCQMSGYAETLRKSVYTFDLDTEKKNHNKYFNWELLYNLKGDGIMQKVVAKEAEILPKYKRLLDGWRKDNSVDVAELEKLNKVVDADLAEFYFTEFGF